MSLQASRSALVLLISDSQRGVGFAKELLTTCAVNYIYTGQTVGFRGENKVEKTPKSGSLDKACS